MARGNRTEVISISELCEQLRVSEEVLRLAIANLYPNFDTIKSVPKTDIPRIADKLPKSLPPEQTGTNQEHGTDTEQTIAELCQKFGVSEEVLRLAIANLYPKNFDTIKSVPQSDIPCIAANLPQPLEPVPEHGTDTEQTKEQTGTLATSQSQELVGTSGTAGTAPQITELLSLQVGEEVQLVDAIAQVRNQLVVHTVKVRNTELVETLNQNWIGTKLQYLGTLHNLTELVQEVVPFNPSITDLDAEINQAMSALGKKLAS